MWTGLHTESGAANKRSLRGLTSLSHPRPRGAGGRDQFVFLWDSNLTFLPSSQQPGGPNFASYLRKEREYHSQQTCRTRTNATARVLSRVLPLRFSLSLSLPNFGQLQVGGGWLIILFQSAAVIKNTKTWCNAKNDAAAATLISHMRPAKE